MEKNIFKPASKNKAGRTLFYIFEIAAVCVGFILFITAIVSAVTASSFLVFMSGLLDVVIYTLVLYGIGRVVDLLYCMNEVGEDQNEEEKK